MPLYLLDFEIALSFKSWTKIEKHNSKHLPISEIVEITITQLISVAAVQQVDGADAADRIVRVQPAVRGDESRSRTGS